MMEIISYLYLGVMYIVASITDYRTREIPIPLFPSALVLYLVLNFGNVGLNSILGMLVMGLPLLVLSIKGKMGGGDLIMFAVTGFIVGFNNIPLFCACVSAVGTLYFVAVKFKNKVCPIAPLAMVAYFIFLAIVVVKNNGGI